MTVTRNFGDMTSCLPGADSGGSQGSGLASANDSTMGSSSHNASPVLSPQSTNIVGLSANGLSFSASSLCSAAVVAAAVSTVSNTLAHSPPVGALDNNNHLSAAAAAAAAGQLNLSDCDSARFAGLPYPRLSAAGSLGSMYSAAAAAATYPSNEQNPYASISVGDNSFYGSLGNPYAMKDGAPGTPGAMDMNAWSSATALQPTGYYAGYDHPSLAAYGYGTGYDLASRRKNATRESTSTLKAWLNEHKKNPYPTKGEKIMLAIITKMTLTQVSTWFANARRRLKKENKMTWEPKNKLDDEDVDVSDDDDKDRDDEKLDETDPRHSHLKDGLHHHLGLHDTSVGDVKSSAGIPIPPSKPKIWSLADTAVCKTPPPSGGGGGHQHHQQQHHQQLQQHHLHQQQQQQYQQPQQAYLHSGIGGSNSSLAASASWGHNFGQFVEPAMMRLRHHGNMLGMGYMGLPTSQQSFTPLGQHHAAAAAAHAAASQLPNTASPGLNSDGVQSNDTPPHTPPTVKSGASSMSNGAFGSSGGVGGYNGLHNGYSQMSPSSGVGTSADAAAAAASKVLMFNSPMNNSSFKMM